MRRPYFIIVQLKGSAMGWPIFTTTPIGPSVAVFTTAFRAEQFRRGLKFGPEWRIAKFKFAELRKWLLHNKTIGIARVLVDPQPEEGLSKAADISDIIELFSH